MHSFICANRVEVFLQTPILHREPADDFSCAGQVERDGNGVLPGCEPTERIGKVTLRDGPVPNGSVVSNLLQIVASVSPLKAMNAASSVASPAFAKMFAKGDPPLRGSRAHPTSSLDSTVEEYFVVHLSPN